MKSYVFPVSLEPDENGWRAFCAPLEHIGASTWGETRDDALSHIHEVLEMIVEESLEDGNDLSDMEGVVVTEGAAVTITR